MSTPPPPTPQLPPTDMLNAIATSATYSGENGGGHSQSWIQSLKPSILIIILILSITVLVSVSLCFFLRHLKRGCIRHLTTTASSSSSSNRRISPEISPTFAIIDSLPLFTFSSITRRSSSTVTAAAAAGGGDCAVCLSKFEPHDQLRLLPLCCHVFHAECIDTWLRSNEINHTCPLCRSPIQVSEVDVMKSMRASTTTNGGDDGGGGGGSFRLEIGSISRHQIPTLDSIESARSYSIGSFNYIVDGESEITVNQMHHGNISNKEENVTPPDTTDPEPNLVSEMASGRSWIDRLSNSLSSRTQSFRSSGRFFTGSNHRSEVSGTMEWDMEAERAGEEISELFRWFSGV